MIKEYCLERRKKLQEKINLNEIKLEHTQITINKNKLQIEKIRNQVDEATNIFSVIAREDNNHKKKEISELEGKIAIYNEEIKELEQRLKDSKDELDKVNKCLEQWESYENKELSEKEMVNNEDLYDSKIEKQVKNVNEEILDKLKFSKSIIKIDPMRAEIELENIIRCIREE